MRESSSSAADVSAMGSVSCAKNLLAIGRGANHFESNHNGQVLGVANPYLDLLLSSSLGSIQSIA
jgi:hypothetical protein